MNGGIRTEKKSEGTNPVWQASRRNVIGIVGWAFALAAAVVLAASYWAKLAAGAQMVLYVVALLLAAAATALCGVGVGRAGSRRLNGFSFCGLLVGAGVLCLCAPQLVAMLA